jgi:hypothetical protein
MWQKLARASGKPDRTLWTLDKDEVDQLDKNKEPAIDGFAYSDFLDSGFKSASFGITGRGTPIYL